MKTATELSEKLLVGIDPVQFQASHRISLDQITSIANKATNMLVNVRESMLAPHPKKKAPIYSTAQVAALCRMDRQKANYYLSQRTDLGLPQGTLKEKGNTREFTLAEAREWVRIVGPFSKRPPGAKGRKIAIGNFKGGVTKTTTAMTLAQGLSLLGRRVLLVDLDPQASLTSLQGVLADSEVSDEETVLPLMVGAQSSIEYAIQPSYWDGIDFVPACAQLFGAEFQLPLKQARDSSFRFWDVLNKGLDPVLDKYDVVIMDTPPSLSYMTINAFMAADGLIVPTPPSALDYASSTQFWNLFSDLTSSMVSAVPNLDKQFDFIHVLLSKVDNRETATSFVREWIKRTYEGLVMPVEIPSTTVAQGAAAFFGTVYDISKYSSNQKTYQRAREAYDRVSEIIDQQLVTLWNTDKVVS